MAEKRSTQTAGTGTPAQLLLLANLQRQIELLQSNGTNSRASTLPTTTISVQQLQQQRYEPFHVLVSEGEQADGV